jgi:hypothetical protein
MAWATEILLTVVSKTPSVTTDWESRSVREGYFLPFAEQQRQITVTVTEQVEECRAVARETALAAVSAPETTGTADDNTTVVTTAARANEADGWTVTRSTTRRQTTRTEWADV